MKKIILLAFFAVMANSIFAACVVERLAGASSLLQPNTEYTFTYRFSKLNLSTGEDSPTAATWTIPTISGATVVSTTPMTGAAAIQITIKTDNTGAPLDMIINATDGTCSAVAQEGSTVLPVELISFEGRNINKNVALEWRTASELNNDFFTVERSTNGKDFKEVGTVKGAGNSVEEVVYTFNDETVNKVASNLVYYRLKQTDFDGTSTYQEMIEIKLDHAKRLEVTNVIVKSNNNIQVKFTSAFNKSVDIQVFDMTGRQVGTSQMDAGEGYNSINLDLENTSKGLYFVRISNGAYMGTRKFVL